MHERKRWDRGHISGQLSGDTPGEEFPDWDNPEDPPEADWREEEEDAPEGRREEDDDSYVPGPDDPDYDLSEAAGYAGWETPHRRGIVPQWVIVVASIILILALLIPILIRLD